MECLEIFVRDRTRNEFDLYGDELKPQFQLALRSKEIEPKEMYATSDDFESRIDEIMNYYQQSTTHKAEYIDRLRSVIKRHIKAFAFSKAELGLTDVL